MKRVMIMEMKMNLMVRERMMLRMGMMMTIRMMMRMCMGVIMTWTIRLMMILGRLEVTITVIVNILEMINAALVMATVIQTETVK